MAIVMAKYLYVRKFKISTPENKGHSDVSWRVSSSVVSCSQDSVLLLSHGKNLRERETCF